MKAVFASLFRLSMFSFSDHIASSSLSNNGASAAAKDISRWLSKIPSEHKDFGKNINFKKEFWELEECIAIRG
jgi:hypothetical protein